MNLEKDVKLDDLDNEFNEIRNNLTKLYLKKNCLNHQLPLKQFIISIEKDVIRKALRVSKGNQRIASFLLSIKPTTLNEKLKKLKINEFRRDNQKLSPQEILKNIDLTSI